MKFLPTIVMVCLSVMLVGGCGSDASQNDDAVGTMQLHLSTTSPLQIEYRLRNATFQIRGPEDRDVSSENYLDDPADQPIDEVLRSGTYMVTLADGWSMEHRAIGQDFMPIPATLTSANPLAVTVITDEVTPAIFQFEVDEGQISFGPGTVALQVGVDEIGAEWQSAIQLPQTHGDQDVPRVAMDAFGNAMATYRELYPTTGARVLYARHYTAATNSWGPPQMVQQTIIEADVESHQLAMDPQGTAMVVWSKRDCFDPTCVDTSIFARRSTAPGVWGPVQSLDDPDLGEAHDPKVAVDPQGNAITVWRQSEATIAYERIWVSRFTPTGEWENPAPLDALGTYDNYYDLAMDAQGNAFLMFSKASGASDVCYVYAKQFTPSQGWGLLQVLNSTEIYPPCHIDVDMDATGNAVFAWTGDPSSTAGGLFGGVISARSFVSSTNTLGDESRRLIFLGTNQVQVAMGPQGYAMIVYSVSVDIAAGSFNVFSGAWEGASGVTTYSAPAQYPDVAMDGRGNAIAVWAQQNNAGTRWDVWTSRYTPAKGWGPQELLEDVNEDNLASGIAPRVAMDPSGTAVAVWRDYYCPIGCGWAVFANHFR